MAATILETLSQTKSLLDEKWASVRCNMPIFINSNHF